MRGISYFLPHVALPCLLLSLVFLALLSSSSIHVQYDTLYMSILFTFCVLPTKDGFDYKHSAEATDVEEDFSF